MTYKHTVPTVYAIWFPDARAMKVGLSGQQRWRNWLVRGAEVIALVEFEDLAEARVFERRNHDYLRSTLASAFSSAEEAAAFTGIVAGGWSEFYIIPVGVEPMSILHKLPTTPEVTQ